MVLKLKVNDGYSSLLVERQILSKQFQGPISVNSLKYAIDRLNHKIKSTVHL